MVFSSSAGLIITVTATVKGKSLNAKQGGGWEVRNGGQALSRMIVVDHSVRLRRPQDSMVLI